MNCELCASDSTGSSYEVGHYVATVCESCREQLGNLSNLEPNRWHCLNEAIWSENPAVKVLAWRVLDRLRAESWAGDLIDQLYLDDELVLLAKSENGKEETENRKPTRDSNGTTLAGGDSVTLIKDLDVKGAGFTAKRGTLVKSIALTDDPGLIEGKVNGMQIVLKTEFLKKA